MNKIPPKPSRLVLKCQQGGAEACRGHWPGLTRRQEIGEEDGDVKRAEKFAKVFKSDDTETDDKGSKAPRRATN